jgi:DNA-binding transcriptional LysR family regulator
MPVFRQRYPASNSNCANRPTRRCSRCEHERLDVGLVRYPTASASALTFQVVERDVFHAVMPKEHPLARGAT